MFWPARLGSLKYLHQGVFNKINYLPLPAALRLSTLASTKGSLSETVGVLYRWTVNLYRSCVGLGWLAQETMRFILVRASEE
jgi:hypothetical protein